MNMPEPKLQEINLQKRAVDTITNISLPVAQIIEEQNDEAELNSALRFVP